MKNPAAGTFNMEGATGKYLLRRQVSSAQPIQLTKVPDEIFENRNELERWIEIENKNNGTGAFFVRWCGAIDEAGPEEFRNGINATV